MPWKRRIGPFDTFLALNEGYLDCWNKTEDGAVCISNTFNQTWMLHHSCVVGNKTCECCLESKLSVGERWLTHFDLCARWTKFELLWSLVLWLARSKLWCEQEDQDVAIELVWAIKAQVGLHLLIMFACFEEPSQSIPKRPYYLSAWSWTKLYTHTSATSTPLS